MTRFLRWATLPRSSVTFDQLFDSEDHYCFLAGSGISIDPPSNLLSGYQFMRYIIQEIIPESEQRKILNLLDPEREAFLRFEQLMEYIEQFDSTLEILNLYADCNQPNFNHFFLAQMLLQGHDILTTNFDSLIEYALLSLNVPHNQLLPIIYKQDWESDLNNNAYRIHKLHGSLFNVHTSKKCRLSIQSTISHITQEKTDLFHLEPWKQKVLSYLLRQKDIIILGYSGLDDFDVLPTLWSIDSPHRIFWINHCEDISLENAVIENIRYEKGDLEQIDGSKIGRVHTNLLRFVENNSRSPTLTFCITVHTGQLLNWFWNKFIQTMVPVFDVPDDKSKNFKINLAPSQKWFLAGQILSNFNLDAYYAFKNAHSLEAVTKTDLSVKALIEMGQSFEHKDKLTHALEHYEEAYQIAKTHGYRSVEATSFRHCGDIFARLGDTDRALEIYTEVLNLTEIFFNPKERVMSLYRIAEIKHSRGLTREGLNFLQEALSITDEEGDLRSRIILLNKIGSFLKIQGDIEQARIYLDQGFSLSELIGDLESLISIYTEIEHINRIQKDQSNVFIQKRLEAICVSNPNFLYRLLIKLKPQSDGDIRKNFQEFDVFDVVIDATIKIIPDLKNLTQQQRFLEILAQIFTGQQDIKSLNLYDQNMREGDIELANATLQSLFFFGAPSLVDDNNLVSYRKGFLTYKIVDILHSNRFRERLPNQFDVLLNFYKQALQIVDKLNYVYDKTQITAKIDQLLANQSQS